MPILIKTHLQQVLNKGIGLIASQSIEKGQVVYRDDLNFDRLITATDFETMHPELREFVNKYCSFNKEENSYYLCMDNSRFLNHSYTPNLQWDETKKEYTASRIIHQDEELTCDYTQIDYFSKNGDLGFEVN